MGQIAEIFKWKLGDCSNGGISSWADAVTIVNVEGVFEPQAERPAALLLAGNVRGTLKVVPAVQKRVCVNCGTDGDESNEAICSVDGLTSSHSYQDRWVQQGQSMMGGSYVATSDSRFTKACEDLLGHSFYGAVAFHDRYETRAESDLLSR